LLKILFIAAFIYMLYNLIVYVIKVGRIVRAKRKEQEIRKDAGRNDRSGQGIGKQVIELDKDQYRVE